MAEKCITGGGTRGGKRLRDQEGWFDPRGGGRGAEVDGEVTVALDITEDVEEEAEVLAEMLGGRQAAGMALPVSSNTS